MDLKAYLIALYSFAGARFWLLLVLMSLLGATQGIGLALIFPFLNIIGIDVGAGEASYIRQFERVLSVIGLPLNLATVMAAYTLIIILYAAATRYKEILSIQMVTGFTHHLRTRVYTYFCYSDWQVFLNTRDSDIIHILTQDIQRVAFATRQIFQLIVSVVILVIYTLFCMTMSFSMTCAAFLCGALFLLLLHPFNRKAVIFGGIFRNSVNRMHALINDHIGGMKVSKSYGLEAYHEKEFETASKEIERQTEAFARINSATRFCYQAGTAVAIAVFITIGIRVFEVPAVHLLIIVFLFSRILPGLSQLQQCFQRIINAMPSFEGVLEMEKKFKKNKETTHPIPNFPNTAFTLDTAIVLDNLWFRYDAASDWALKQVRLTIPARQITAVSGASGTGKTTLADLLLGLLVPATGRIFIDSTPLDKENRITWRQSVGYVPQESYLFHESIRDNLKKAAPSTDDTQLWLALEHAAAKEFVQGLPAQLDTIVGDRGIRLSGGERQRIALARALLRNPLLLVLDEATSALDQKNEQKILSALVKLKGHLTIVIIAHGHSPRKIADHTILME